MCILLTTHENNKYLFYINVREYRRANEKGQSRETGNIGYARRRKKNRTQYVLDTYTNNAIIILFDIHN